MKKRIKHPKRQPVKKTAVKKVSSTKPIRLGTKRFCAHCNTKFYDFGKSKITCPNCKGTIDANFVPRSYVPPATRTYVRRLTVPKRPAQFIDDSPIDTDTALVDLHELEGSEVFVRGMDMADGEESTY